MIEETAAFYSSKLLPPQVKPSPSPTAGLYPNQARSQNHFSSQFLQAAKVRTYSSKLPFLQTKWHNKKLSADLNLIFIRVQLMKQHHQQQMLKKGVYGPRVTEFQLHNGRRNCDDGRAHGLSMAAWPGLQPPSSGARAVYLGEPEPKKERTGTGVFLPKRFGSIPAVSRKKSGDLATDHGILFELITLSLFLFSV